MRLASLITGERPFLAARRGDGYVDLTAVDPSLGADVGALLASGADWYPRAAAAVPDAPPAPAEVAFRPVCPAPAAFLCLGLNDVDHAAEARLPVPTFPVVFTRLASSLIGHLQPMVRPHESHRLDYEVELAVIIGRGGRRIPEASALDHVAGYTVFNDGSIRDWQTKTHQWTIGKNFDKTGALGPELVTTDELPPGAVGLRLTTRIGDELLQDGNTRAMIFGVARTIAILSQAVTLRPGDVIAMGTPAGVGGARKPPRWLLPGEVCRVAIEGIGELHSPILHDPSPVSETAPTLDPVEGGV
jgi:2-keto-4-pentenoate hydratase/2-oxohepta-3-ene-1,7-dioic acid hydratase in catechol pathway